MRIARAWITTSVAVVTTATVLHPVAADAGSRGLRPVAGTAAVAAARAPVVGAQTSGDSLFPHQGNGGYDVQHYDLAIAWTTSNTITATATITALTTGAPLSQFSLDLEGLTVGGVTVDGATAETHRIADAESGKHKLVVSPAAPVEGEFTTVVTYSGSPDGHTDPDGSREGWIVTTGNEGAVALNEPVGAMTWFPNNNTPTDKATFTTRVTVPSSIAPGFDKTAVSNGVLTSTVENGPTTTFNWTQSEQQATYLALVGIGSYVEAVGTVALTDGSVPEWSYRDLTLSDAGSGFVTRRAQQSPILKALEGYYGPYPGTAAGLVVDVSALGYALETMDRPYFESSIAQGTLIHELAHQWFGNAVSPTDWSDIWLNEGPATFLETQITHDLYGGASTQNTYFQGWSSRAAGSAFWAMPIAGFDDAADLFAPSVYQRGAMALEALRSSVGDRVFTSIMRTWIQRNTGGDASTSDFIALAEEVSGYDLTALFQEWVFDADKPGAWPVAYELSLASSPATGATVVPGEHVTYTLTAQNSGKVPTGASVVEVDVADVLAQGSLDSLPSGVSLDGSTLVWSVPATAVGDTSTVTVGATLTSGGVADVTARGRTLGADCGACTSTITVDAEEISPSPVPTVSGTLRTGETLTGTVGAWADGASLTYRWLRDGDPIADATGTTYRLEPADVGSRIAFRVTGTKPGADDTVRTSAPSDLVAPGVQTLRPRPTVQGTYRVGRILRAAAGAHDPGTTIGYQWLADGKRVKGATSPRLRLTPAMRGTLVKVVTISSKPGYHPVVKASRPRTVKRALAP